VKRAVCLALLVACATAAQVYSPKVLVKDQPDASDLRLFTQGIYRQAGAHTPRERAEAIWRFFLTDGRFVKPGFWYHIAGWAYEEPMGEVLDTTKLLNSYGFGLCYQIAPVLEAVWRAGGFEDARVWFLTGHTVAEVFYDGAYHHYDSDMLGYNTIGRGPAKQSPVASVHQLESDGNIILSKLKGPRDVDHSVVDDPWYPADVREGAMGGLVELFTTTSDNHLFPFERAPHGHTMDFTLRPGERLVRYFSPERPDLRYLPYKFNGHAWEEFPQEVAEYNVRTADGPRSQKDDRTWATGRIEYRPPVDARESAIYDVRSPYVVIDAEFQFSAALASASQSLQVETSTDGGRTWVAVGVLHGPHQGNWRAEPAVLTRSEHGRRTAVSGSYGYLVRITRSPGTELQKIFLLTRIQLNPRTLPALANGHNELVYSAGTPRLRQPIPIAAASVREVAQSVTHARYVSDAGQGYWIPVAGGAAEFVFRLTSPGATLLSGFDVGGHFLDLSAGLAPDKFTAEVRKVTALKADNAAASIAWSNSPNGPFQTIWEFDPHLQWKDGIPIDRTLLWPEVDRHIEAVGAREIYVRYRIQGLAIDDFRLAMMTPASPPSSALKVTHVWKEDGVTRTAVRQIPAGVDERRYAIDIAPRAGISNQAIIFEAQ
jgi:hypothetical protein